MDTSKVKQVFKKIGFLRDYSSLVVSVIITLVAVVILVLVPMLMGSKLKESIDRQSVSAGKKVKNLMRSAVSKMQVEEEKKYQDKYAEDVNMIQLLSVQCTQRELLSYKLFPEPIERSTVILDEFGDNFRKGIDGLISKFKGGDCPTEEQLSESISLMSSAAAETSTVNITSDDVKVNTIREELCRERAESLSFYINPDKLRGYKFWGEYKFTKWEGAIKDCWYWQLGYWVIEDVINTIGAMNKSGGSVLTSPVKRLESVSFGGESTGGQQSKGGPGYFVSKGESQESEGVFTGRVSNEDIDVLHFDVSVLIDSQAVLPFMQELCSGKVHKFNSFFGQDEQKIFSHNQITILGSKMEIIDKSDKSEHERYRYGERAVLKLNLTCEYLFNKKGYEEIKPELTKTPEGDEILKNRNWESE